MYLLDTDHLSDWQWKNRPAFDWLQHRLLATDPNSIYVSIASFHEQFMGWNSRIQRSKTTLAVVDGYAKMRRAFDHFTKMQVLPFDAIAADEFDRIRSLRVGVMDLRIAAIALSRDLTLLTRNFADFEKVPNLKYEDWTVPLTSDDD